MSESRRTGALFAVVFAAQLAAAATVDATGGGIVASTFESSSISLQHGGADVSTASSRSSSDARASNSSNSSNQSSDESSAESSRSSDSSSDDQPRRRPRKVTVPQQVRDEAVLWLAGSAQAPPSALLRSTVQAFRQVLVDEARRPKNGELALSDRDVLALLLQRTEGATQAAGDATGARVSATAPAAQPAGGLVHAQAVGGSQASRAQGRVQGRQQADQKGHAADEGHLCPRDIRR